MNLGKMSKDERSLLLFLETQVVDYGGLVDVRHMNDVDMKIAKRWREDGYITFGRIAFESIKKLVRGKRKPTHWCQFTSEAFRDAHDERRQRAYRMFSKRTWIAL